MTTSERAQRMAERILEDESLRGDLEDDAATALIDWASAQAAAAAESDRSDALVEAQVQAIRTAARAAALSGETEPKHLLALAAAGLAQSADTAKLAPPAVSTGASASANPSAATGASVAENTAPAPNAAPVLEAPTSVEVAPPATPSVPSAPLIEQPSSAAPKPTKPAGPRPRRKRSRLARFFKHLLSGH